MVKWNSFLNQGAKILHFLIRISHALLLPVLNQNAKCKTQNAKRETRNAKRGTQIIL